MVNIEVISNAVLDEKTYVVYNNNTLNAIIIDPGSDFNKIANLIKDKALSILAVLITHAHFDHIASCKKLQDLGYKVYVSSLDADKCLNLDLCLANSSSEYIETFTPDVIIDKTEVELNIGEFVVGIIHVPGHSKGGLAFTIENNLFSGDTLFEHGYGRYDFYDGNFRDLLNSIKILREFVKRGYILHPGH